MVKQISIITLVTRPNNLILIKESIESISWNGWDTEWVLILDDEFLGFNEFDKDDYISTYFKKITGNGQDGESRSSGRNLGQEVAKYNLTFHLDDDNLLHPNFYNGLDELVKDEAPMYIFSQDCGDQQWWYWDNTPFKIRNCFYEEKTDMTPEEESMYGYNQWRKGAVDMAQAVFTKDDILFDNFVGGSNNDGEDFDFINKYKEKYGNKIIYKDIVMSYYNKLDWSVE